MCLCPQLSAIWGLVHRGSVSLSAVLVGGRPRLHPDSLFPPQRRVADHKHKQKLWRSAFPHSSILFPHSRFIWFSVRVHLISILASPFSVDSHKDDGSELQTNELYQLGWRRAFSALKVSLCENRAPLQHAGRGRSIFGLRSFLNITPPGPVARRLFFCPNHKNPWEKQGSVTWSSLSYWTPARCERERSTRQHLFSERLRPLSVLHVVGALKLNKMKGLWFLCLGS